MLAQTCAVLLPNSCNPSMSVECKTKSHQVQCRAKQQSQKSRSHNCDSLMLFPPIRLQIPAPENSGKTKHEARNRTEPVLMHYSLSCSLVDIAGLKGQKWILCWCSGVTKTIGSRSRHTSRNSRAFRRSLLLCSSSRSSGRREVLGS